MLDSIYHMMIKLFSICNYVFVVKQYFTKYMRHSYERHFIMLTKSVNQTRRHIIDYNYRYQNTLTKKACPNDKVTDLLKRDCFNSFLASSGDLSSTDNPYIQF